ncbi:hypothetical protein [Streptomyces sp. NPDC005385]|uniref:hypothetical protein n=1 Tax=Streptomyces sp. NPDC005385 TaxID=3157039 RepID=UPI0033BF7764
MKTTQEPPVTLGLPLDPPEPVPGCDVCRALAHQRREAVRKGDLSRATDRSIELRNHPHEAGTA